LTQACLARIGRLNPKLNAFITVTSELALEQARTAEIEIQQGHYRGPLHGIPIGLKDNIDTAGTRTTAASAAFADRIPAEDAEVVSRLKSAGAVIVGKLNLSEFAHSATATISHFGPVHNPWQLDYVAGGSSGGNAAAVAAGLCYGAIGTDTGASIRLPAACCGIVGLKPTYGLVSTAGVIPDSWSFDHVGPMCRTVVDTAVLLSGIAGYKAEDSGRIDVPREDYLQAVRRKPTSLRLGRVLFERNADTNPNAEIVAVQNRAYEVLRRMTAGWREISLSSKDELFGSVADPEAYAFHAARLEKAPELYNPETRKALLDGAKVSLATYMQGRRELDEARRSAARIFADLDLLVTATVTRPPLAIVDSHEAFPDMGYASLGEFNILGLPAISIPCGFTRAGFPVGLQIIGPPFGERRVLALAHAYERSTDWWKRRPRL